MDSQPPMSYGSGKLTLFLVMVLGLGAAGGFAWYRDGQAKRKIAEQHAAVGTCQQSLVECAADRDAKVKAAEASSASLSASRAELDELRTEHAEAEKRLALFKSLTDKFQKMIDSGKLQVIFRNGRMVVKLPAAVLFASGSAELSKEGNDALRDVAGILKQVPDRRFMVAGHTDNVPIDPRAVPPPPFKNNLELSTARALTVAQHLIASGMSPIRLVAAGYSAHEPVRENTTEAGRQENRRIEIVLMPNLSELPTRPTMDAGVPDASVKPAASVVAPDGGAKP
jgi:chemotaxis protein MotB